MRQDNYYSEYTDPTYQSQVLSASETNKAFAKSYLWMFLGALITLISGVASTVLLGNVLMSSSGAGYIAFLILFFVVFAVEMVLCFKINKNALISMNFKKAFSTFLVFSALNGFSFSFLFIYFDLAILNQVFLGVCLYFLILSFITYLFRNKIEKASSFAFVGLITLLIASAVISVMSWFLYGSETYFALVLGISILGLIVFTIITMVDIKTMHRLISYSDNKKCAAVYCAFNLYLDFINIFVYILRILLILGKNVIRRD